MKKGTTFFFALLATLITICSCGTSEKDLIGKEFDMKDGYHVIEFTSSTSYSIYQKPHSCGGNGSWSFKDGKVILGPNNSNCSSTQEIEGTYSVSDFK